MIIPSIDIKGGKVVQLRQGRETVFTDSRDPMELAQYFGRFGSVAVIDLDAAMGTGNNRDLLIECCQVAPCRVGGGIRSKDDVVGWIKRGAEKVIIGTAATPEFLGQFPREWIVAAVDARDDQVVVEGWQTSLGKPVDETAQLLAPFCSELLYTCVEREGMLMGANLDTALRLRRLVTGGLTVAGGLASMDEVRELISAGCNVQLGRAVYENHLDLAEAWVAQVTFDERGLVTTVVQDADSRQVRMVAYSNRDSLKEALRTGQGWYFSRSRRELWRKGGTSGNTQALMTARWDCDRDAVLFRVRQTGPTCHKGSDCCFDVTQTGILESLSRTIRARGNSKDTTSYTNRLLNDPALVKAKLREEIEEVIEAQCPDDVAWEAADVIYHLLVRAESRGVSWDRICHELRSRMSATA